MTIVYSRGDFDNYLKLIEYLNQRPNQSREAISQMIKYSFNTVFPQLTEERQKALLSKLILVTEGKIFVELEYSQAVRKMAELHMKNNDLVEATKIIQDVQIEAFGSLERNYKVDYILFQMRILIAKEDYIRVLIVSNKINRKHLNDEGFELLKIEFYLLMIKYYSHESQYIEVSKCYKILFDFVKEIKGKLEKPNDIKASVIDNFLAVTQNNDINSLFQNYVLYLSICPPELETRNMFNELNLNYKKDLDSNQDLLFIVTKRLSDDLIEISQNLFDTFLKYPIFELNPRLMSLFRKYWIQHNIVIFEKFFSAVQLKRIASISGIEIEEVETEIADMVINKFIYAKINRINQTVNFRKITDYHDVLNEMTYDMAQMLKGLENTCHLINKEYLKYGIK